MLELQPGLAVSVIETHTKLSGSAMSPVAFLAQVQYEGVDYNLRVLELQPGPAVSVIETDIAADVGPSIETEGYLRAQAEVAAREAERHRQAQEQAEREAAEVGFPLGCLQHYGCGSACSVVAGRQHFCVGCTAVQRV